MLLVLGGVIAVAGEVGAALIFFRTSEGDYVVETDNPDFTFQVHKDGGVILEDQKKKRSYVLKVRRRDKGEPRVWR